MEYLVNDKKYNISYQELRGKYLEVCILTDSEFIENLAPIIHLATIICYFKEIPTYVCLSDEGIIHELAHLLHIQEHTLPKLTEIRELFKTQLNLAP